MTKKQDSFLEETKQYYTAKTALEQRLNVAAEIIRNTSRKLTVPVPEELHWGYGYTFTEYRVINTAVSKYRNEVEEQLMLEDSLQFTVNSKKYAVPLQLLTNDPVSVAQYVRKLTRETFEKNKKLSLSEVKKEISTLQKQQEVAQLKYETLRNRTLKEPSLKK